MAIPLPRDRKDLIHVLALAAVYAAAGVVVLSLPESGLELRRMVWPSTGIAIPKSTNLTAPSRDNITLRGDRSR